MLELLSNFRLQDVVDIAIAAFVVYRVIDLICGTRAARMLIGLFLVFSTYISSQFFSLYTVNWILDNFFSSLPLVVVVIFQRDIRHVLTQVGTRLGGERRWQGEYLEEIVCAVVTLASTRTGALIVF